MPAGRPTKYRPEFCERVVEMGKEGKSPVQMAVALGVCRAVLDVWADAHPEFLDAFTRAKESAQAWWEDSAMNGSANDIIGPAVWKKSMEARFRDQYTERKEVSGPDGGAIPTEIKISFVD